jgi:predicted nucleic acid-binding protein
VTSKLSGRIAADTNVLLAAALGAAAARVFSSPMNLRVVTTEASAYESHLEEASQYLAKRDPTDIPLTALALKLEIPVWSNDRDFEELPLIAYPTAKLLKILGL